MACDYTDLETHDLVPEWEADDLPPSLGLDVVLPNSVGQNKKHGPEHTVPDAL